MKAGEMSAAFPARSSALLFSPPCGRLKMLPVTPSPTLLQFHESPCWVAHSKTGLGDILLLTRKGHRVSWLHVVWGQ